VDEGWFTVGEGNPNTWELGYKAGQNVQIFSNQQAKAMTGMNNPPGYAAGTGININMMSDRLIAGLLRGLSIPMPSGGVGGSLGAWIAQAIALTGVPASWGPALARRARFESGGNPRAINLTDQNARAGHPSKGLMQTIDSTFNAYDLPGHGNIWNPVDNMAAAIRYILSRYGSIFAIDPPVRGYRRGTARTMKMLPGYATGTKAAATRLRSEALRIRIEIDKGDLSALSRALKGTAADIAQRMHALIIDLQKAAAFGHGDVHNPILMAIERDNVVLGNLAKRRDQLTRQLQAATQRLADLRKATVEERQTVAGAVTGGFDITTGGQFQVGSTTQATAARILLDLQRNVRQANAFAAQLAQLRRRGLSATLLRQLGEAGYQTAGVNVAALSHATAAQLRQINAAYGQLGRAGQSAGATVAGALFTKQIQVQQRLVTELTHQRHDTNLRMAQLISTINHYAQVLANRPVRLVANGRELAKLVNDQNRALARR
jgi:hypothetical protein